jgi:GH35 family endo-1,4-beta-xylanase
MCHEGYGGEADCRGSDVVNEAIGDGPEYLRETPAKRAIGDDHAIQAFRFAQAADPEVALYYNNYPVRGRTNYPLLFDRQLQPKQAFQAVVEVLQNGQSAK